MLLATLTGRYGCYGRLDWTAFEFFGHYVIAKALAGDYRENIFRPKQSLAGYLL
jgi:hypothetical protein